MKTQSEMECRLKFKPEHFNYIMVRFNPRLIAEFGSSSFAQFAVASWQMFPQTLVEIVRHFGRSSWFWYIVSLEFSHRQK